MSENVLSIKKLNVSIGEKHILHDIDLTVDSGEVHVLMGPNGAGKSTLGSAVVGNPAYKTESGKIIFMGQDITNAAPDKRARAGIFMSFQNPPEIGGVSLSSFLRTAVEQRRSQRVKLWEFKKELNEAMELLEMDPSYADRELNVGFSGGEKKKSEILQMLLLKPSLAVLDETDSGLDVDAVRIVSKGIKEYVENYGGSLLVITHSTRILEAISVDRTHVLVGGRIIKSGGAELVNEINENGFAEYENS